MNSDNARVSGGNLLPRFLARTHSRPVDSVLGLTLVSWHDFLARADLVVLSFGCGWLVQWLRLLLQLLQGSAEQVLCGVLALEAMLPAQVYAPMRASKHAQPWLELDANVCCFSSLLVSDNVGVMQCWCWCSRCWEGCWWCDDDDDDAIFKALMMLRSRQQGMTTT